MTGFSSSKRRLLDGGRALGGLGILGLAKPGSLGGNHNAYFMGLGKALDEAGLARPTLVIDRQRLQQHITTLKNHLGDRYHCRVVGKSLPS
jgi:hypothetical protein